MEEVVIKLKNIVFLTYLNLWSMDKNKGAPSFYKTIEAYIKDGWNVILINPNYNLGVTPKLEGLKIITFKPIFFPLVKLKKISFFGRILHSLQGNFMFYRIGKKVIKEFNYQAIIYSYEVNGVLGGKKLREKYCLPFITRFQGTVLAPLKNNWLNRLKRYPHFQALETEADLTIMTDDGTQGDEVLNNLNNRSKKVLFWKNGVDINTNEQKNDIAITKIREKLGLSPSDEVLMTVSRLASWKKVNRAIEALSVIIKKRPECKLVIVGDGNEKQNLINLTKKLNLESNVIFAGSVPQIEVKNYLNLADIFLSLYDLSNVGNPLLEAMSCGKPIITLDVGNTSSIIKNEVNGILLDLEQLNKLPEYIHKILNDKCFAEKLGKNAKHYAKKYFWSWDERMKAELAIVNTLIKRWNFNKK